VDRQERHWRQYIGDLHHDWRVYKMWGCSNIMLEQRKLTISRRELEFWFQTKSSPPHKWVLAIAERHPQWHITLTAFDAEAGAWNYTLASDGKEWTQQKWHNPIATKQHIRFRHRRWNRLTLDSPPSRVESFP